LSGGLEVLTSISWKKLAFARLKKMDVLGSEVSWKVFERFFPLKHM
jgi:hypothetical protein